MPVIHDKTGELAFVSEYNTLQMAVLSCEENCLVKKNSLEIVSCYSDDDLASMLVKGIYASYRHL